jgi:hypothetical protein
VGCGSVDARAPCHCGAAGAGGCAGARGSSEVSAVWRVVCGWGWRGAPTAPSACCLLGARRGLGASRERAEVARGVVGLRVRERVSGGRSPCRGRWRCAVARSWRWPSSARPAEGGPVCGRCASVYGPTPVVVGTSASGGPVCGRCASVKGPTPWPSGVAGGATAAGHRWTTASVDRSACPALSTLGRVRDGVDGHDVPAGHKGRISHHDHTHLLGRPDRRPSTRGRDRHRPRRRSVTNPSTKPCRCTSTSPAWSPTLVVSITTTRGLLLRFRPEDN